MIEEEILELLERGRAGALVTIIDKSGSAPRLPGTKMFIGVDGSRYGTVGGGRMERQICHLAEEVAAGGEPLLTEFDLRGSGAGDSDMVCGGVVLVLIEQINPAMAPMFGRAVACLQEGGPGLWLIDITRPQRPQRRFLNLLKDPVPDDMPLGQVMDHRITRLIRSRDKTLVFDPLPARGTVILFGGGHVAVEVAHLAVYADFSVTVCDDRAEFARPERFPMAKATHVLEEFRNIRRILDQEEDAYLLILTRGHSHDQEVLAQALRTRARYIGMIGSRRKRDILYANLRKQGFADRDFDRVHCPVGLNIGSETPREIAISIVAELVAARSGVV